MKNMKKILVLALAAVLLVAVSIGGTIAYLTDKTEEVENTFSPAEIEITLEETSGTSFALVPSKTYMKNPVVAVDGDKTDVDIWLFVEIVDESAAAYLSTYDCTLYDVDTQGNKTAANGWTKGDGTSIPETVYYRKVLTIDTTKSWELIAGNTVTVDVDLGSTELPMPTDDVKLTYKAYAMQLANGSGEFTAAQAWAQVKSDPTTDNGTDGE